VRRTIKIHPFTLCALVLAANDLLMCILGVSPYAILILAKRPEPSSFPFWLCKIFGFVNNFCDRFAWFDITSIMVFRCITMAFPLKLRGVSHRPFIYILALLALLQGVICILPFFNLEMMSESYVYIPNTAECSFGVDGELVPGMVVLIDLLWWGPFLACIISCVLFFIFMKMHAKKCGTASSKNDKSNDAKKKTAILTFFFIVCYFPKALLILFDFLLLTERFGLSWQWYTGFLGVDNALTLYLYLSVMCKLVIPAGRAAFTPTMLRLRSYIKMCDSSRRKKTSKVETSQSRLSTCVKSVFKSDSRSLLKKRKSDTELKSGKKTEQSHLV